MGLSRLRRLGAAQIEEHGDLVAHIVAQIRRALLEHGPAPIERRTGSSTSWTQCSARVECQCASTNGLRSGGTSASRRVASSESPDAADRYPCHCPSDKRATPSAHTTAGAIMRPGPRPTRRGPGGPGAHGLHLPPDGRAGCGGCGMTASGPRVVGLPRDRQPGRAVQPEMHVVIVGPLGHGMVSGARSENKRPRLALGQGGQRAAPGETRGGQGWRYHAARSSGSTCAQGRTGGTPGAGPTLGGRLVDGDGALGGGLDCAAALSRNTTAAPLGDRHRSYPNDNGEFFLVSDKSGSGIDGVHAGSINPSFSASTFCLLPHLSALVNFVFMSPMEKCSGRNYSSFTFRWQTSAASVSEAKT